MQHRMRQLRYNLRRQMRCVFLAEAGGQQTTLIAHKAQLGPGQGFRSLGPRDDGFPRRLLPFCIERLRNEKAASGFANARLYYFLSWSQELPFPISNKNAGQNMRTSYDKSLEKSRFDIIKKPIKASPNATTPRITHGPHSMNT